MEMRSIHLACGQVVCRPGDVEGNLHQIERLSAEAARAGARLCLFAEGAISGYMLTEQAFADALREDGPAARELKRIAASCKIVVAAGTMEGAADGVYVSHFIAFPDGRLLVQRKNVLNEREKKAGLARGPEARIPFQVDGVRMGLIVCADAGIPDIYNKLAAQGCQVCLHPSAGGGGREHMCHPEDLEDPARRKAYLQMMRQVCFIGGAMETAARHHMAIALVNLAGDDGVDHYHPGHTAIVDSRGRCMMLHPGEYVVDYLEPRMFHAEVLVREPRVVRAS